MSMPLEDREQFLKDGVVITDDVEDVLKKGNIAKSHPLSPFC